MEECTDMATHLSVSICAGLSVGGCVLIIVSGLLVKKLQSYTFRLVRYLSLFDLFASISNSYSGFLIPGHRSSTLCLIQAVLQNYSQLGSLLITVIISYSLYGMVVKENSKIPNYEKRLVGSCFAIPLILTPLPLITESYDVSGGWCWIKLDLNLANIIWIFVEFYGPLIVILIVNIYFYIKIFKKVWSETYFGVDCEITKKLLSRLKMYPIVLIICFTPGLFRRIYYIFYEDTCYLNLFVGSLCALYGFFNAIAYGMTRKVRSSLRLAFSKLFSKSETLEITEIFNDKNRS
jgi:Slime mold cyclic AMP receptor